MDNCVKALGNAVLWRAVKDFCNTKSRYKRRNIIRDLKSDWMDFLTNGFSRIVAEKLAHNPNEIIKRVKGAKSYESN